MISSVWQWFAISALTLGIFVRLLPAPHQPLVLVVALALLVLALQASRRARSVWTAGLTLMSVLALMIPAAALTHATLVRIDVLCLVTFAATCSALMACRVPAVPTIGSGWQL